MSFDLQFEGGLAPTEHEAAALIAAIELFLQDITLPAGADPGSRGNGWLRAALHEGVGSADPSSIWE
jgi:hypothetical protein